VAGSARFRRRVRVQGNRPCASRLGAVGVKAERERRLCEWLHKYACSARTGAVRSRRVSSCANRSVRPAMLKHHLCVGRGSSTREQEDLEIRGGVGIANQSGSIVSSHESTTSSSSYSSPIVRARPQHLKKAFGPSHRTSSIPVYRNILAVAIVATGHHERYFSSHSPPTTIPWQASSSFPHRNLATVEHFSSPILCTAGIHFPPVLLHN
jgi:hypothetical protein